MSWEGVDSIVKHRLYKYTATQADFDAHAVAGAPYTKQSVQVGLCAPFWHHVDGRQPQRRAASGRTKGVSWSKNRAAQKNRLGFQTA